MEQISRVLKVFPGRFAAELGLDVKAGPEDR
jgi:hypothetical protein